MLELLRRRRSTRRFRDEPIDVATRRRLEEAVLRSPSSRGLRPWELIFVDDRDALDALSRCKPHGASFVRDAALAVIVCGDPSRCDVWIEDCSIASLILHLAAEAEGLGSCWVQIRRRAHADGRSSEQVVREVLGIPEGLRVLSLVAMGHRAEEQPGHGAETLPREKIHAGRW